MAHLFKGSVSEPEGEDGAVGRVVVGPCLVCSLPWDDPIHQDYLALLREPVYKAPEPPYVCRMGTAQDPHFYDRPLEDD
jgi:hypothetical protein